MVCCEADALPESKSGTADFLGLPNMLPGGFEHRFQPKPVTAAMLHVLKAHPTALEGLFRTISELGLLDPKPDALPGCATPRSWLF
jgi:hypothetical protein